MNLVVTTDRKFARVLNNQPFYQFCVYEVIHLQFQAIAAVTHGPTIPQLLQANVQSVVMESADWTWPRFPVLRLSQSFGFLWIKSRSLFSG
jgi:hypothetical protein